LSASVAIARDAQPARSPFVSAILRWTAGDTRQAVTRLGWIGFSLALVVLAGQALLGVDPQDEGQFLTYPWLIANGHMPYRDIWMSYPPATYLILALFFKLGAPGLVAERGLGLVARVAYILLVNRTLTKSWTRFSWLGVSVAFSLVFISSDIKAYPWLVALPLLFLALLTAGDRHRTSASLFFLAGTFRFEFGLAGCVTFLALVNLAVLDRRSCRREIVALGGLTFALVALYVLLNGFTDGAAIQQIFTDQIVYAEPARRIPLFPLAFGPLGVPLVPVTLLGPLLLLFVGLRRGLPHPAATNLAVITLLPHFFQRTDASHLFSTAVITVPWTVVGLYALLDGSSPGSWSRTRVLAPAPPTRRQASVLGAALGWTGITAGVWCSLIVLGYAAYLSPLSPLDTDNITHVSSRLVDNGKNIIIDSTASQAHDDRQVIAYLERHGRPSQSVFITPLAVSSAYTRTDLYYALGFRPASMYMELQAGVQTRPVVQRRILRQIKDCRWVIVVKGGMWYRGTDAGHIPKSDLIEPFLHRHFDSVMQNGTYDVLAPTSVTARVGR